VYVYMGELRNRLEILSYVGLGNHIEFGMMLEIYYSVGLKGVRTDAHSLLTYKLESISTKRFNLLVRRCFTCTFERLIY
jgi:hypothetical protein